MMTIPACLILSLAAATGDPSELELASALARRGWIDLADELCVRIEKLPGASIVLAEVATARARQEPDPAQGAKVLDAAIARLGPTLSLEERAMAGYLRVQKARLLNEPGAWEAAEAFYRDSIGVLSAAPNAEEALLDARLEFAKAMAARARVSPGDETARKKISAEAIRLLLDFQMDTGVRPIAFEAILEEARARADLKDPAGAERCFRSVLALRKKGAPLGEYLGSLHDAAFLGLLKTLASGGKAKEAIAAAELFAKEQPARAKSMFGLAVRLETIEALLSTGNRAGAVAVAQGIIAADPQGPIGAAARGRLLELTKGDDATGPQLLLAAEGLMERGLFREALVPLRRSVEVSRAPAEREMIEPAASFKRGECFRALKRDVEASLAFQEVFRKFPKHELAQRAAFEAVRSLIRSAAGTRDRRDEQEMEALLREIRQREVQGAFADLFAFLEAEALERKGSWKAAAELYQKVGPASEVFDEALVCAAHCLRRDVDAKGDPKELALAESLLTQAVARLEKSTQPRLRAQAEYDLASLLLPGKPKEALEFVERCAKLLPADSEMLPRLGEMEIRARLALDDVAGAASRLDGLLAGTPGMAAARSARRVALKLETSDPVRAARYYGAWLEAAETGDVTPTEARSVADGLARVARSRNRFDDKIHSLLDLRGKAVAERAVWKAAARAQARLLSIPDLSSEERSAAESSLVSFEALGAETVEDWTRLKKRCEGLMERHGLLGKQGLDPAVLQKERWLAGMYLEYGAALLHLGKAGQKYQFANAQTVYSRLHGVTEHGSEPWWVCQWMQLRILFERGEGNDLKTADAMMSLLEGNNPGFDRGRYGMKDALEALRDEIRASVGRRK
ncbi:MAG: hypothetical protein JO332_05645 [Planctomycetaceae bacterium]|nr:hypothetical protein [Planctomycetaceae bacterium]